MRIPPRFQLATPGSLPERMFTDRIQELELFRHTLRNLSTQGHCVINYYGVGGIGKSRLQRELQKIVKREFQGRSVRLDLQSPAFRRHEAAIYQLAHALRSDYHLRFPRLDIAYASYWQRTNP